MLSEAEAAQYLGIPVDALAGYRSRRQVAFYSFGTRVAYKQADLDAFLEDHPELWQRVEVDSAQSPPSPDPPRPILVDGIGRPVSAASPLRSAPNPLPEAIAEANLSDEELAARQDLVRGMVESGRQEKAPEGLPFTRPLELTIQGPEGPVDLGNPYEGLESNKIAGFGLAPDAEDY